MILQAQLEMPNECCGLLAGVVENGVGKVSADYPLANELQSPIEYNAEARGLLQAHKDMRDRGIDLLAIYHSHPTSEPIPSKTDLQRCYDPSVAYFIVSLSGVARLKCWWLSVDAFREVDWMVCGG